MKQIHPGLESAYVSTGTAARLLGVGSRHVRKLIATGALAARDVAAPGAARKTYRIERASIQRFQHGEISSL